MRDQQTNQARSLLERQLANYLKTSACFTGAMRERVEMLADLVRQELAELDKASRPSAPRQAGDVWRGPAPWWLRPGQADRSRSGNKPAPLANEAMPASRRHKARGVA